MRPYNDLVNRLNRFLVKETWKAGTDYISNRIVSEVANAFINDVPLVRGILKVDIDYSDVPRVSSRRDEKITIRIPQRNKHHLSFDCDIMDPVPDPTITLRFSVNILAQDTDPKVQVDVDIDIDWVSDFVLGLIGGPGLVVTKKTIQESVELIATKIIENELEKFGGFNTYRFDINDNLNYGPISLLQPQNNNNYTPSHSNDPKAKGYTDIILVADGFSNHTINDFDDFSQIVVDNFYSSNGLEPFKKFRSSIRFWKLPISSPDPDNPNNRIVVSTPEASNKKLNFSNLAIAAEVDLLAKDFFWRDPVIVFASTGISSGRSVCQGPYILLRKGADNLKAYNLLLHELGHTPLGNYLADEYIELSAPEHYRGLEPIAKNITVNQLNAIGKWGNWSNGQPRLQHEGAYEHRKGIFRFRDKCRMNDEYNGTFCPICREQIALGLLDYGHYISGKGSVKGFIGIEVEYLTLSPIMGKEGPFHVEGGDSINLKSIRGIASEVKISIVNSSVPYDWEATWDVTYAADSDPYPIHHIGNELIVPTEKRTLIKLKLRHLINQSNLLSSGTQSPESEIEINFTNNYRLTRDEILPPYDLEQSVGVGENMDLLISDNGTIKYAGELWLAGKIGGLKNYDVDSYIDFLLESSDNFKKEKIPGGFDSKNSKRRWRISELLPPGEYFWFARSRWEAPAYLGGRYTLSSDWVPAPEIGGLCFSIGNIPFDPNPAPPRDPFELQLYSALFSTNGVIESVQAKSWHPNDLEIKFVFEFKKIDENFDESDLIETELLSRDPSVLESIAITSIINVPREVKNQIGEIIKWRVKAVDSMDRSSNWVNGSNFPVILPSNQITPREFFELISDPRLDDFARRFGSMTIGIDPIRPIGRNPWSRPFDGPFDPRNP
jgi:hypothetical protein